MGFTMAVVGAGLKELLTKCSSHLHVSTYVDPDARATIAAAVSEDGTIGEWGSEAVIMEPDLDLFEV